MNPSQWLYVRAFSEVRWPNSRLVVSVRNRHTHWGPRRQPRSVRARGLCQRRHITDRLRQSLLRRRGIHAKATPDDQAIRRPTGMFRGRVSRRQRALVTAVVSIESLGATGGEPRRREYHRAADRRDGGRRQESQAHRQTHPKQPAINLLLQTKGFQLFGGDGPGVRLGPGRPLGALATTGQRGS